MRTGNYFTYITTNPAKTVIYVGMTNDIARRLSEHFQNRGNPKNWAGRYYCYNLVWYERHSRPMDAIDREKEIKKWRREKKNNLIEIENTEWKFLNKEVGAWEYLD